MSAGSVAVDVLLAIVRAAPAVGEVLARMIGTSPEEVTARLELARATIVEPIDPSIPDAARRAKLEAVLRGTSRGRIAPDFPGPVDVSPAPAPKAADRVIGCSDCGKPSALVGDRIPLDGLCPWCRAVSAPLVAGLYALEPAGDRVTPVPPNPYEDA